MCESFLYLFRLQLSDYGIHNILSKSIPKLVFLEKSGISLKLPYFLFAIDRSNKISLIISHIF